MIIGFDLDGTLDHPSILNLCKSLIESNHEVHIISGCFDEAGEWQDEYAKNDKLDFLDIPYHDAKDIIEPEAGKATLHVLHAVKHGDYDINYRIRDLGMRKGNLCRELGVEVMIDDSALQCDAMPAMNRGLAVLQVR